MILLTFCLLSNYAQNCDIAHTGVALFNAANTAQIASVTTGQSANFRFTIANFGSDVNCSIPANTVNAVFNFPMATKAYRYDGPTTFTSGYFTWQYDALENVLRGTNTSAIPNGKGDVDILVKVKGTLAGAGVSQLMLTQKNGIADNWANDNSSAQLKVTGAPLLPVQLGSFDVKADKCNAVLNWTTSSEESSFSYFDVEYSSDGSTYLKIGTLKGKTQSAGSLYGFTYFQLSGTGFYRLKQVAKDGTFEYSNIVRTSTNCTEKGKILVYPNPINYNQKLSVNISGYPGKITGDLYDAMGQRVGSYNLVNGSNELSVLHLSSGTYMLYVRSNGQEESFKLVVSR
jgi:hypothetical protein